VTGHIYPIEIPEAVVERNRDFLLLELPPRYFPLMPNGVAYVHSALEQNGIKVQTLDINIIMYHRYHSKRLLDDDFQQATESGHPLPEDLWLPTTTAMFGQPEVVEWVIPQFEELFSSIARHRPKIVGISLSGDNTSLAERFVTEIRSSYPDVVIVVGGYTCIYADIGPNVFHNFDYMVIGEAEVVLPDLVKSLLKGERPKDIPGIISKLDPPDRPKVQSVLPQNVEEYGYPTYEWMDLSLYRSYDGNHIVPIVNARGCSWSLCRFCGECITFRIRSPKSVADEMEYFINRGFDYFHFNASDLNGDAQQLYDICTEIIERKLKVRMIGQLRIKKTNTAEWFQHLVDAGFIHLRFGVDAWCNNVLKLQRKGYNMRMVMENLRDCKATGVVTTVNMVIGVPGETEEDITESIENIIKCKDLIDQVESLNTLGLMAGSVYYNFPEDHKIRFIGNKEDIYAKYSNCIPPEYWYTEEPYNDHKIRVDRLNRICDTLHSAGIDIGSFAAQVVERNRREVGATPYALPSNGANQPHRVTQYIPQPGEVELVEDLDPYNLVRLNDRFVAILKSLGKIEVGEEKIGEREVLPYIVRGESAGAILARIRRERIFNRSNEEDYTIVPFEDSYVGLHYCLDEAVVGEDLLMFWELAPYIYSEPDLNDLRSRLEQPVPAVESQRYIGAWN